MNVLSKLTIKNLKLNKKRTMVTVIGIILSVAMLSAVASMFFSARDSFIRYEKRKAGDCHYVFRDVPAEDMQVFRWNRKIESAYPVKEIGYAHLDGGVNEYKPYLYVEALSSEAMKHMGIRMVDGRLPQSEDEILISSHIATNGGVTYNIGDTLTLDVGRRESEDSLLRQQNPYNPDVKEEIVDTKQKTYQVVGVMERLETTIEDYEAPGYTCFTLLTQEFNTGSADIYVRYTKDGLKEHDTITAGILGITEQEFWTGEEGKYPYASNSYLIQIESGILSDGTMRSLATAGMFVVLIIIFTSVFCIKNSFDISIAEKTRQYGMLRSVGATKRQIRKNVYYEATILGLLGIPAGLIFGNLASYVLLQITNQFLKGNLNVTLSYQFSWLAILFGLLLGFVTVYLSAGRGAKRAAKITPIQAISNSGEIKLRPGKLHAPKWVNRFFGIGGEISYKNLKRSKKKYRTTVISIIVCVATFIATASFVDLAFDTIRWELKASDYSLRVSWSKDVDDIEYVRQIRALDGIEESTYFTYNDVKVDKALYSKEYLEIYPDSPAEDEEEFITLCVVDEETFHAYVEKLHLSYDKVKDQGVLLNYIHEYVQKTPEEDDFQEVEIPMYAYKAGDTIGGIRIAALSKEVFFGLDEFQSCARLVVNRAYYDNGADYYNNYMYIKCENATKVQGEIEEICKDDETLNIDNREEATKSMEAFYTLLAIFLYGFIIVIALIGVTSIFNTITTNMELRRQEFAMLKSVGMTSREFNRMIRLESFFYGSKSLLIGVPIGCVLSYVIYKLLADGSMDVGYRLPVKPILISIVCVFALILVIMRYSIGRIRRQNMIETIRNENI